MLLSLSALAGVSGASCCCGPPSEFGWNPLLKLRSRGPGEAYGVGLPLVENCHHLSPHLRNTCFDLWPVIHLFLWGGTSGSPEFFGAFFNSLLWVNILIYIDRYLIHVFKCACSFPLFLHLVYLCCYLTFNKIFKNYNNLLITLLSVIFGKSWNKYIFVYTLQCCDV